MTNTYGLIGKLLSHSFSPAYFAEKFEKLNLNAKYRLFELDDISKLPEFIRKYPNLKGLNVTIPYKKEVLLLLDELDEVAKATGSVNTIQIKYENGKTILKGFNTDVIGFEQTLFPFIENRKAIKALVLGTGGSALAVAFVLNKLGIDFVYVSRNPNPLKQINYSEITKSVLENYHLIIQTTPLGMFPNTDNFPPIPYELLGKNHLLYDLVYNPKETVFMKKGKQNGAVAINGQKMLEIQADASWKIWETNI
jgi:shikimate dehydrogenase